MSSPDPEWLLWREHYKIQSRSVSEQLHALTQTTSRITALTANIADLTAGSERLKTNNDTLSSRITRLEKDALQQDELSRYLQVENDILKERIVHLEQDASLQNQINAMDSQARGDLEAKIKSLKGDHVNMTEGVELALETVKAEREGHRKELEEMRVQMESFMKNLPQKIDPPSEKWIDLADLFPSSPRKARAMSQATTTDESVHSDEETSTQLVPATQYNSIPGSTQLYTQYPEATHIDAIAPNISMTAQGSLPTEDYMKNGGDHVAESLRLCEMQLVKAFVSGLRDQRGQKLLINRLNKKGWTWEQAKDEIHSMIADGKKRKKGRRTIPVFA